MVENPTAELGMAIPAAVNLSPVFPVCAVTCAQARKFDLVDLSDSFLCTDDHDNIEMPLVIHEKSV